MRLIFILIVFLNSLFANYFAEGMKEYGKGNEQKALELFRESCKKDGVDSCYYIAKHFEAGYDAGFSLKKDKSYAKEFYEMSCNAGKYEACSRLAHSYLKGVLGEKDFLKALELYKIGCNKGKFSSDCEKLTLIYGKGIGKIKQDIKKSNEYLQKACDNGSYKFCFYLGNKLYMGQDMPKDYEKSFKLFDKVCTFTGMDKSCMMKGYFYFLGYGVEKDYYEAETTFQYLCKNGYERACKELKKFYREVDIKNNKSYLDSKQKFLKKQIAKTYSIDPKTNLIWQDDLDSKNLKKDFKGAEQYCNNLTLGGYDDWRLPNGSELKSLLDKQSKTNTIPIIKNARFGDYWSSSIVEKDKAQWSIGFDYLIHLIMPIERPLYIRCVRGNELPLDTLRFYTKHERIK